MLPDRETLNNSLDRDIESQCTYRCVVLPDKRERFFIARKEDVSMHLQVRGAP